MISKPSRLALLGMAFACAAFLSACNDSPRLQFITVAPVSGEIYVSAQPAGGVRGAARSHVRPALKGTGTTGRRPAITVQPVTATCGSLQYAATGLLSNGSTKDLTSTATWTSSSTSVATVNSSGLASGIGLGTTNIGASFTGVSSATEPLAVDQLNSITLSPSGIVTVPLGSSQSFLAIGNFTFAAGGPPGNLDVSSQVTWNSSNMAVATIDTSGNATTVGTGSTTITATSCDGVMVGSATLIVGAAAPQSLQISPAAPTINTGTTTLFTAVELLSDGTTQPLTGAVTWTSSTTTTATIDMNTGVALGLAVGTTPTTITATEAGTGFTGTATLTVQAAAARFAYIGNIAGNGTASVGGPGSISGYTVDVAAGTLTPLTGSPFTASSPQQVLIHPSGDLLYYIDAGSSIQTDFVDSGKSGSGGALTASNRAPSLAGSGGTNVGVIDPLGRFIYVIEDSGTIYGFTIAQTNTQSTNGVLTAIPGLTAYTDPTLNVPSWVMTDRAGKFLYVVNSGNSTISEYSITQTGPNAGVLTQLGTPIIGTGDGTNSPLFGTTDVNGHLYVGNFGTVDSVSAYTIDPTSGQLSSAGADKVITGATQTINVLTDPTGKYIYVLDQNVTSSSSPGQVFAYNLDPATGLLTTQIGAAQPTGATPQGMAIDPTGALLAVDNNVSETISLYTVTQTGTSAGGLTPTSPIASVPTDHVPQFVVFYTAASGQ